MKDTQVYSSYHYQSGKSRVHFPYNSKCELAEQTKRPADSIVLAAHIKHCVHSCYNWTLGYT